MSRLRNERVEELFVEAQQLAPDARETFLERECTGDPQLHAEVAALLAAATESEHYFERLSGRIGVAALLASSKEGVGEAGSVVGGYRLIRELGSGGMASVWLAERADGLLNRPVALKFPHGAWRQAGLAERMARERDILASLTHPNIARLYDSGLTTDGQPYLALEYVEGVPIDQYCRSKELGVRERLQLFLKVTEAVAYAHAQLIVHRDLKPSNVLVTSIGEVRLLDFGIAKLLAQGGDTQQTQFAGRALTLNYASPEQILGQPVTTASDIYSLGVLLFELLAGVLPYRLDRQSQGALEEAILHTDALRPSDLAPPAMRKVLRGDVDTIVLKALKKDAAQRYATVNAFAEDIARHLRSEPVLARPDSFWYRCNRFVLRNRLAVSAAALVLLAILFGSAAALRQASIATAERQRAEEINRLITSMFQQADPYRTAGEPLTGAQLLRRAHADLGDRFLDHPDRRIELLNLIGESLINLGDLEGAEAALQQARAESIRAYGENHAYTLQARVLLTEVLNTRRDTDAVQQALNELVPAARAQLETHPEILVRALKLQTDLAIEQGRFDEMRAPVSEALKIAQARLGQEHPLTEAASGLLAETFVIRSDSIPRMLEETQRALDHATSVHRNRPDHPRVLHAREVHARGLAVAGLFRESVTESRAVMEALERIFGPSSAQVAYAMSNMAPYERRLGELEESLRHTEAALTVFASGGRQNSADYAGLLVTRGVTLQTARRPQDALPALTQAEGIFRELFGADHWDTLTAAFNRAVTLANLGQFQQAQAALAPARDPSTRIQSPWWLAHIDGTVRRLSGDYEGAIAAQSEADRLIPPGPRADWDRLRVWAERGQAELATGRMEAARSSFSEARALFVRLDTRMHPPYAETLAGLGATLVDSKPAAALPLLENASAFWMQHDPDNPAGGEAAYWLARCYEALRHSGSAAEQRARARRLLAASALPRDKDLLRLMPQR